MNSGVKYILTLICSSIISLCNGQQIIDSVKIIPLNPTTADSIYVITSVTMATTSNGYLGYDLSSSGTIINIEACYKHGMLDAPETYIDTINLGVKPIGEYTLNFIAYSTHFIPCDHSDTSDFQTNFLVTTPLGISESETEFTVRFFPNPATDIIQINSNFQIEEIKIIDLSGRVVFQSNDNTITSQSIFVQHLSDGIYQIVIQGADLFYSESFVKMSE